MRLRHVAGARDESFTHDYSVIDFKVNALMHSAALLRDGGVMDALTHPPLRSIAPPFVSCSNLKVVPVGMSKGVKKLLQEKLPNMSKLEDISELLLK